jgi:hypothetical protein
MSACGCGKYAVKLAEAFAGMHGRAVQVTTVPDDQQTHDMPVAGSSLARPPEHNRKMFPDLRSRSVVEPFTVRRPMQLLTPSFAGLRHQRSVYWFTHRVRTKLGSVGLPEVPSLGPESLRDFVW